MPHTFTSPTGHGARVSPARRKARRTRAARLEALVVAAALFVGACASEPPAPPPLPLPRVVVIADPHVIGSQYTEAIERTPENNESIFHTPARLARARDLINALDPQPLAVFVLGDVVHHAHHSEDFEWYLANESAYSVAAGIFEGFSAPLHFVFGNHDYHVRCSGQTYSRELSERLFAHFFGAEPYGAVDVGGFRFLLLNNQQGPTWDAEDERCQTGSGSFGAAQLEWARAQLEEGLPTVVLTHYPSLVQEREEAEGLAHPDLPSLLDAYENVKLAFAGHLHRWLSLRGREFEEIILGATRFDADNFLVLELDADAEAVRAVDRGKIRASHSCAPSYDYGVDPPAPDEDAVEDGTCVVNLR